MVTFRPVIEFDTFRLCPNTPVPNGIRGPYNEAEWLDNWRRRIADLRLEANLAVIEQSDMFYLEDVWEHRYAIQRLLDAWFEDDDELSDDPEENVYFASPLYGGLAVLVEGEPTIMPDCCGALDNLEDWFDVVCGEKQCGLLWTGHPGLFFKKNEAMIHFGRASEPPVDSALPMLLKSEPIIFSVEAERLFSQL